MASFDRITSLPREEFVRTVLISIVRHGARPAGRFLAMSGLSLTR